MSTNSTTPGRSHGRTRLFAVPAITALFDIGSTFTAFGLAFWLRFYSPFTNWFPVVLGIPPVSSILVAAGFGSFFLVGLYALRGYYRFVPGHGFRDDIVRMVKQVIVAWVLLIAANFFYRDSTWSRGMYLFQLGCWVVIATFARWLAFRVKRYLHHRGLGMLRTVLVGHGEAAHLLTERLKHLHHNGV